MQLAGDRFIRTASKPPAATQQASADRCPTPFALTEDVDDILHASIDPLERAIVCVKGFEQRLS